MIQIPSTVKIGGFEFEISYPPRDVIDPDDKGYIGRYNYAAARIFILRSIGSNRAFQVFWHEILHGICDQRNIQLEEPAIDALAYGVSGFLLENGLWRFDANELGTTARTDATTQDP
jgi:hypothetical protein